MTAETKTKSFIERRNAMIRKCMLMALFCITTIAFMSGCGKDYGKVDQGRVIEFDKEKGTVTFIRDLKTDPGNPEYTQLPPLTYTLPKNYGDNGSEPKTGYRMKLDTKKSQIIIFEPNAKNFKTLDYKVVKQTDGVEKDDSFVYDKATGKAKEFPVIDKLAKTITIYSRRQKILTTFAVADEYLELPAKTWEAGDDVRIDYKEAGKALRVTNISRMDSYKK
jgi:hypothetical protein